MLLTKNHVSVQMQLSIKPTLYICLHKRVYIYCQDIAFFVSPSINFVRTEMPGQLFVGLLRHFVQMDICDAKRINLTDSGDPWPFLYPHQQVKTFTYSLKYLNIYKMDWYEHARRPQYEVWKRWRAHNLSPTVIIWWNLRFLQQFGWWSNVSKTNDFAINANEEMSVC